jgi:hypothetical protein
MRRVLRQIALGRFDELGDLSGLAEPQVGWGAALPPQGPRGLRVGAGDVGAPRAPAAQTAPQSHTSDRAPLRR